MQTPLLFPSLFFFLIAMNLNFNETQIKKVASPVNGFGIVLIVHPFALASLRVSKALRGILFLEVKFKHFTHARTSLAISKLVVSSRRAASFVCVRWPSTRCHFVIRMNMSLIELR
jgi:hypothetical protein